MNIDDAINLAELTASFMRASYKTQNMPLDHNAMSLIESMETLATYAKKCRVKEIQASIKNDGIVKKLWDKGGH